jgi:hypothetical protein
VVSLLRGNWMEAGVSLVAAGVPYAGDLAKVAKIPPYAARVERAIRLAKESASLAACLRPVLARLRWAIDRLPLDGIPPGVRDALTRIRVSIDGFLPSAGVAVGRLDHVYDEVTRRVFGSSVNIGVLPRRNIRTIVDFFDKHKVEGGNPEKWAELIKGIDLHAPTPVTVMPLRKGHTVAQYVEVARPRDRQVGQWMVEAHGSRGQFTPGSLGISGAGRAPRQFRVTKDVEVLVSRNATVVDHWTMARPTPHTTRVMDGGKRLTKTGVEATGGGTQYFLPRAWESLEEIPGAP